MTLSQNRSRRIFVMGMTTLVLMPIVAIATITLVGGFDVQALKVYGQVPPFRLVERSGAEVSSDFFYGKIWIASFVFTHCSGQCPLVCQQLAKIQNRLRFKEKLRLVSITVDPKRDHPEVLSEYAKKFKADPYQWLFLTGDVREIKSLIEHGFRLSSGLSSPGNEISPLSHSFKLVLVDSLGRIRGYYDGLDPGEIKKLLKDTKELLRQAV